MDETHKVAVTRLGDRIRVGGTAELTGYSNLLREPRRETLNHVVSDLFPKGGDVSKAKFWCGLRPMTPDGTPIIGATPIRQPAAGHRARHAGLDHGGRHRARDRRPGRRPAAGDRHRGADDGPLRGAPGAAERAATRSASWRPGRSSSLFRCPQHRAAVAALIHEEFWTEVPGASVEGMTARLARATRSTRVPMTPRRAARRAADRRRQPGRERRRGPSPTGHPGWPAWWWPRLARARRRVGPGARLLAEARRIGVPRVYFGTDGPGFYTRLGAVVHLGAARGLLVHALRSATTGPCGPPPRIPADGEDPAITKKRRSACSRASSPSSSGPACTPAPTTRCTWCRR